MFGRRFRLFRLFGFDVQADLSWLLIAALVTWTLAAGYFPSLYTDLNIETYWLMGVVGALSLFASIIIHEFAHSLVARRYGLPIGGITLFLFGGVAHLEREPNSPKTEFLVAVVGPITSFVLAGIFFGLHSLATAMAWPVTVDGVIRYLSFINLVVAVFNLLPAFPLDGGRMLRAGLWAWRGQLRWASRIASGIGSILGIALIVLGVVEVISGGFITGMWWFLIGLFVKMAAGSAYQQTLLREGLKGVPVARVMNDNPISVSPDISVQELVDEYFYRRYLKTLPVVEDGHVRGCVLLRDVSGTDRATWVETRVRDVMRPIKGQAIEPSTDALSALSLMRKTGNSRLLVLDGPRLVGVLSSKDLMNFLSLRLELEEGEDLGFDSGSNPIRTFFSDLRDRSDSSHGKA